MFLFLLIQALFFNVVSDIWPPMTTITRGRWPVQHYADAVSAVHAVAHDHTGDIKEQTVLLWRQGQNILFDPSEPPFLCAFSQKAARGYRTSKKTQKPLTSIVHLKELHWVVSGSTYEATG